MWSSQGTGTARARSRACRQGARRERAMTTEHGDRSLDPDRSETTPQPPADASESVPGNAPPADATAYSSSSGDELNLLLGGSSTELKPDPFLIPLSSGDADAVPIAPGQAPPPSESFDTVAPVAPPEPAGSAALE